jgi:hypothetical protein
MNLLARPDRLGLIWAGAALLCWLVAAWSMFGLRRGLRPEYRMAIEARSRNDRLTGISGRRDYLFAPAQYFTAAGLAHRRRFLTAAAVFVALILTLPLLEGFLRR